MVTICLFIEPTFLADPLQQQERPPSQKLARFLRMSPASNTD